MSVVFTIADTSGNILFDITKHRLIRYIKSVTILSSQWYQSTTTAAIWYCDYPGVSPKTHMSTSANVTVLTNKLQHYNQYDPLTTNPGDQVVEIFGI